MTTLAANEARPFVLGDENDFPAMADIFYEGSAVGLVDATGHARPLTSADRFVGFVQEQLDNSAGSAADRNVRVRKRGVVQLPVTGAVITDVGLPIYATDDNAFAFSPVGGVFIGKVIRFASSGVVDVEFDAGNMADPLGGRIWETFSTAATLDIQDTAKGFWVDTDAQTLTMLTYAAGTAMDIIVMTGGAFGTVGTTVDVAAGDVMSGPDDTGAGGGITTNTKATARRGDYIQVSTGGDDGYIIVEKRGIWTIA
ncbi:MAG: hypothetical protein GY928_25785 [Colwellia sp.]|nr:hypothetical protein [Colwellia sp.]